ncbi:hypothetical protein L227DRAFT_34317 [Lentinus tigrinus ALCF2SS1-6]|uniref:Uncharacterized protein n=1 Tax=Lentinus tigrinus ALCF2SS1-6 TaxID=1328759 RepID=A0A5C2SFD0_9APHY|nr:hypothetical protein L227DRAFT_34317 [Lentinus tigrinus ALCF2SS1-6]
MMFPRPRRANVAQWLRASKQTRGARHASRKSNPWPEPQGTAEAPKARTWIYPVSRIANFTIVPTAILYAVFFADFGDHEHVFMPPRRWLDAQKASFFSLTPEEQRLAGVDTATSDTPKQGSGTHQ